MTRDQLVAAFRARVFDTAAPYLWSDLEAFEFLEDGYAEACERANLLRDSQTPAICEVAVVAATAAYQLDPRIISVERAKLDLQRTPLGLTATAEMDGPATRSAYRASDARYISGGWPAELGAGWETRTGAPRRALLDRETNHWQLRLNPIPTEDDTLRLIVFRLPLAALGANDEPEFSSRLHIRLVDWMEHRAYAKKDAETADVAKANAALAMFSSAFGERIDANRRRTQQDRAPKVTVFHEF